MRTTKPTTTSSDNEARKPRSEQRQRSAPTVGVRMSEAETNLLSHARIRATKLGAALPESDAGFLRWLALEKASEIVGETVVPTRRPPAAQRAPSIDAIAVAKLAGQVGKLGNNVNQVAKKMHQTGDIPSAAAAREITVAINRLSHAVAALAGVHAEHESEADSVTESEAFFGIEDDDEPDARSSVRKPLPEPSQARPRSVSGWRSGSTGGGAN